MHNVNNITGQPRASFTHSSGGEHSQRSETPSSRAVKRALFTQPSEAQAVSSPHQMSQRQVSASFESEVGSRSSSTYRTSLSPNDASLLALQCDEDISDILDSASSSKKVKLTQTPRITDQQREFRNLCIRLANFPTLGRSQQNYSLLVQRERGSFLQVYRISPESPPLIEGIKNDDLLVKLFHREAIQRSPYKLQSFMENALAQYKQLSDKQEEYPFIQIPKIFNRDTAAEDGYYIVEYIPYPINTTAWQNPSILFEELDEKSQKILHQVRKYLRLMENEKILMDLKPNNFRMTVDGTLYLIDFAEDFDEDDGISLIPCLVQALELWSANNQNICNFLNEGAQIKQLREHKANFRVSMGT